MHTGDGTGGHSPHQIHGPGPSSLVSASDQMHRPGILHREPPYAVHSELVPQPNDAPGPGAGTLPPPPGPGPPSSLTIQGQMAPATGYWFMGAGQAEHYQEPNQ